jgi:hypothetical protein
MGCLLSEYHLAQDFETRTLRSSLLGWNEFSFICVIALLLEHEIRVEHLLRVGRAFVQVHK